MSGHSHWKKVKYAKGTANSKKSQAFSKLAKEIEIAAREKGGNPAFNPKLRMAIDKAKEWNIPTDNIERAIKRGAGELEGVKLESLLLEAYGPGGVAIIVEGITDNKNRVLAEIKQALSRHGAKMVSEGGVRWMFERKFKESGSLEWQPKQEIEVSAQDREACEKLFEALDENEAVQEIYSNLKV